MGITSVTITLCLSRPPPFSHPLSSSNSRNNSISLLNKTKSGLIVGQPRRRWNGRKGLTCNALFGLGVPELVVIAGVAALLFGPKNLPDVGRSIGKTVNSFQQAAKEFESELKKEPEPQSDKNRTAVGEEKNTDVESLSL
ncbi:hypothetical protein HRI_004888800 [Hibiscus trionum]|uniref:Sec-independent protein translocase protein TATA, chloroplastic n=1 Tax=Hibiscus trionum TaxID=183268 RepID=A0A9W7JCT9_HIBTR|nr:hypothetical protein HRI_004888800 [Hibiscus trionum]